MKIPCTRKIIPVVLGSVCFLNNRYYFSLTESQCVLFLRSWITSIAVIKSIRPAICSLMIKMYIWITALPRRAIHIPLRPFVIRIATAFTGIAHTVGRIVTRHHRTTTAISGIAPGFSVIFLIVISFFLRLGKLLNLRLLPFCPHFFFFVTHLCCTSLKPKNKIAYRILLRDHTIGESIWYKINK